MEEIQEKVIELLEVLLEFLSHTEVIFQLVIVVAIFMPALFLSWKIEPIMEERVRRIRGMPGVLRVTAAFMRRLEWVFFIVFAAIAYVVTNVLQWPANNHLIYAAMMLALAWLVITVFSSIFRNRAARRFFAVLAWVYVAAAILGITDDVARLLDEAGFQMGTFRLSLLSIIRAIVLLVILMWLATSIGNFLDKRVQSYEELTPSLRVLIGKVTRIALIAVAILLAMSGIGIDLTAFTVLSGAVGVGIGFGLQKVVSNFISGIIILLDESIKPGDTITLGNTFGWIRELRARFVSVVTRDGKEYLIPNEDFITREVVNWSFTDRLVRLDVEFGVSYDSDPHEVSRIAIEAASSVDRVVTTTKKPVCWLTEFGESSLNFKLRFWIDDPRDGLTNIRGKVMLALWDALKENGIRIPYPHRRVIIDKTNDLPDTA